MQIPVNVHTPSGLARPGKLCTSVIEGPHLQVYELIMNHHRLAGVYVSHPVATQGRDVHVDLGVNVGLNVGVGVPVGVKETLQQRTCATTPQRQR